ncbi:MAG: EAL domain-containing response regulator [Actinobacteria bacterium]|nr:EAL domain-containing response regulator [Actinomycetota bacterium]
MPHMGPIELPTADSRDGRGGGGPPEPVLVVDDDALIRRLVSIRLTDAGFEVIQAPDGESALDLVAERRFSVVLLDNQMPGLSGPEVLRRLRASSATATLPVIMVTASATVDDRVAGLQAGADDYITKPFSMEEVVARVRAQIRAHQAWEEALADQARRRSALSRSLAVAGRQATLEATAQVLCNAVAGQGGVESAALVRFSADGLAVPIAVCGAPLWDMAVASPLPPALRRHLVAKAKAGPWVESDRATGAAPPLVGPRTVACAPLADSTSLHGLLLLGLAEGVTVDPSAALAGAIDFAAVSYGLLHSRLADRHRLEADRTELRWVLQEGAFTPAFQPIVRLSDGEPVGVEALTRFADGSNPETRFKQAALLGVGHELEVATMASALRHAASLPAGWLSINVSPSLMLNSDELRSVLAQRDREVVLELSEQEAVADYEALRSAMSGVGGKVRLSVDDAGAGFASLRHILRLQPAFVKLDRSWVKGVDGDPARQALIAGLRYFADQTGAELIAEGVEREEELNALVDLGVDYGQGYLLGRPVASVA